MKMVKKILGLVGMLLGIGALTVVFTAFMQLGMQALVKNVGLTIMIPAFVFLIWVAWRKNVWKNGSKVLLTKEGR